MLKTFHALKSMCSHLGADPTPRGLVQVELWIVVSNSDVSQFLGLVVCMSERRAQGEVEEHLKVLKVCRAMYSHLGVDLTPRDLVQVELWIVVSNSDVSQFLGLVCMSERRAQGEVEERLKVLKVCRVMCSHLGADLTPRGLVQVDLWIVVSNSDASQFLGLAVCMRNRELREQGEVEEHLNVLKAPPALTCPQPYAVYVGDASHFLIYYIHIIKFKARDISTTYQHWGVS